MGAKMLKLHAFAKQVGGTKAQMRLAMKTFTEAQAKTERDSDENVRRMRDAIKQITGKDAPVV
jgi:hypothetical protein